MLLVAHRTFWPPVCRPAGINLMVAIDYTGSNGHPLDAGSLHFINPVAPNEYLQVCATGEAGETTAGVDVRARQLPGLGSCWLLESPCHSSWSNG
jgi:hypothetical protein